MSDSAQSVPLVPPPSVERGLFYHHDDSPGFFFRVLIAIIDFAAVVALAAGVGYLLERLLPAHSVRIIAGSILLMCWTYEVPLKRSRLGTLGYLLFRVRIVDLHGHQPGLFRMSVRTLVSCAFNPIIDLIWLTSDDSRQGLRDKLCGTYIVRRSAVPAGQGELVYVNVFFVGMNLIYREVRRN